MALALQDALKQLKQIDDQTALITFIKEQQPLNKALVHVIFDKLSLTKKNVWQNQEVLTQWVNAIEAHERDNAENSLFSAFTQTHYRYTYLIIQLNTQKGVNLFLSTH